MAFLSVIRRRALGDQMSIREKARRTGLSRNTIRKYLRSGAVEPRFQVPQRPSKLGPFADKLSAWLSAELRKPRKQRRTVSHAANATMSKRALDSETVLDGLLAILMEHGQLWERLRERAG